ncbi:MAG: hypothetical protein LBK56_06840 [Gracilibacteraceae bacterium]|jgi:hypothetical protein|nr:hypothetical protein [Gracilibacteraceae bacterium]
MNITELIGPEIRQRMNQSLAEYFGPQPLRTSENDGGAESLRLYTKEKGVDYYQSAEEFGEHIFGEKPVFTCNGIKITVAVATPDQVYEMTGINATSKEDFILQMWRMNLRDVVDFDAVANDFNKTFALTVDYDDPNKIDQAMDQFAARYAYTKMKIINDYDGAEEENALARLDGIFDAGMEEYAAKVAAAVTGRLEEYGHGQGEYEKIRSGVISATKDLAEEFISFAATNSDYAGIAGTENAWLSDVGDFMVASLRNTYALANPSADSGQSADAAAGGYSKTDILGIVHLLNEFKTTDQYTGYSSSDQEIGYRAGYMAMKAEAILAQPGATENARDLLISYAVSAMEEFNRDWTLFTQNLLLQGGDNGERTQYAYILLGRVKESETTGGVFDISA